VPAQADIPISEYTGLIYFGLYALAMQVLISVCLIAALVLYIKNGGSVFDLDFLKNDIVIFEKQESGKIVYELAKN